MSSVSSETAANPPAATLSRTDLGTHLNSKMYEYVVPRNSATLEITPYLMSSEAEGTTRARRAREACSCASPICFTSASRSRSQEALWWVQT